DLRYRTGETRLLEKTTAETQQNEVHNLLMRSKADIVIYEKLLETLMHSEQPVSIVPGALSERSLVISLDSAVINANPELAYSKQGIEIAEKEKKVAGAKFLPDLNVGYFNQTLIGTPLNNSGELATSQNRFQGFQIGLSLPLWFGPQAAKVRAADINREKAQAQYE